MVEVELVITDDDASKVPGSVNVLTEERYSRVSPKEIPPVVEVEEARESIEVGVVVPSPRRLVLEL